MPDPLDLYELPADLSDEERQVSETWNLRVVEPMLTAAVALEQAGFRLERGAWRRRP